LIHLIGKEVAVALSISAQLLLTVKNKFKLRKVWDLWYKVLVCEYRIILPKNYRLHCRGLYYAFMMEQRD
jgi:hypothetical protein